MRILVSINNERGTGMSFDLNAIAPVLMEVSRSAPIKGRTVKAQGKVGKVFWHGRDRYSFAFRYGGEATAHLRECAGRYGYRIGVETEEGRIFVKADEAIVCVES